MAKLEQMTPEQEEAMLAHRDYWLRVGLSTKPADRTKTEEVITEFYKRLNVAKPYFWWCDGPMVAQFVMNFFRNVYKEDLKGANLGANLQDKLLNLSDDLCANLENNLLDYLWDDLLENLETNLLDNSLDYLLSKSPYPEYFFTFLWGSLDSFKVAYYLFPQEHLGVKYNTDDAELLSLWADLSKSAFYWWPFENVVLLSDRPKEIHKDAEGRLHCETGPACSFRDGWGIYCWHSVSIPSDIVEDRSSITVKRIQEERNAEIRRVMIEIYTPERFILDSGATPTHWDQ